MSHAYRAGLDEDCPFQPSQDGQPAVQLSEDTVDEVPVEQFSDYVSRLYTYLQARPWLPTSALIAARLLCASQAAGIPLG